MKVRIKMKKENMTKAMEFVKEWNKRSAKNGFEKILEEKYSFGYDDGEAKGKTEGILETARNMLRNCFSVDDVQKATNLPKAKIKSIQKQIELES